VLVQQGRVVAGTFHPELTGSRALHQYLLDLAHARRPARSGAAGTAHPPGP